MVRDFVNRLFNGSAKPLMVHLAENEQFTAEELAEIRRLLQEKPR
jgi:predicted transcriptional regulator